MIPKYRAWDKSKKLMIEDVVVIDIYNDYIGYLYESEILHDVVVSRLPINEAILMQSTGLKDKNGVEIYEGDIVVALAQGYKAVGEVKRRVDGLWILFPAHQKGKLWGFCPNPKGETRVEVVGNIYENKDLMGEIK